MSEQYIELSRIIINIAIALMAMTVPTYAFAFPHLRTEALRSKERIDNEREALQEKLRNKEFADLKELEDRLASLYEEAEQLTSKLGKMSFRNTVLAPLGCFGGAVVFACYGLYYSQSGANAFFSVLLIICGLALILDALRCVEGLALRPEEKHSVDLEYKIKTTSDWTSFEIESGERWAIHDITVLQGDDRLIASPYSSPRKIKLQKKPSDISPVEIVMKATMIIPKEELYSDIRYLIEKGSLGSTDVKIFSGNTEISFLSHTGTIPFNPHNPRTFKIPVSQHMKKA